MNEKQANEKTELLEKPKYKIVKEMFFTDSGTELPLGYYIANTGNQQVLPSVDQVFTSFAKASEELRTPEQRMQEAARISRQIWALKKSEGK